MKSRSESLRRAAEDRERLRRRIAQLLGGARDEPPSAPWREAVAEVLGGRKRRALTQEERDAAVLGVSVDASRGEVRRAWRALVATAHPDRFPARQRARQQRETAQLNEVYQRICKRRGW